VMAAYYVARGEVGAEELRAHVARSVYEEVTPSAWVRLKRLPLTLNGKVNVEALPPVEESQGQSAGEGEAPRSAVEEVVAGIWCEVLGLKSVSVGESFFTVGGHSLLATQVISRVREAFGVEVPLRSLFEARTVARFADYVEQRLAAAHGTVLPPIQPAGRERPLPLSFAQQRLWFLQMLEPNSSAYNIPAAVRLLGALDVAALERSLSEVVRRHEALRTTFHLVDAQPVQRVAPAQEVRLPFTDLQGLPAQEREAHARQLITAEAQRPFDLAAGPLLRAGLLKLDEEEHVALLTMHHIVSDGWSIEVLVKELGALYEAYSTGAESPLAELPVQYADYAAWQRGWLQGEVLEEQLGYWRKQLGGAPAVLELPTDRPRPRVQSYRGAYETFAVGQELTERLRALGRREGVTLFMTLLAAWQAQLSRYSGQDGISVGSPVANRRRAETEGLIACFVNTLVLHTRLSGNPSFRELLRRVREVTLEAYAHQDLPFEVLVEALRPERNANYTPLFQVWFVFQNAPMQSVALRGLTLRPMPIESRTAQFDLALSIQETEAGLEGHMDYNTDLFDADTVAEILEHYTALLEAFAGDPELRLLDAPVGEEKYAAVNPPPAVQTADEFAF
ncbi:MAG: condensation domain-containing protein, partial [Pyrinomonadaceae bacterium]